MSGNSGGKLVDLDLHWHGETERAIKVSQDGDAFKAIWLPKSQIEYERAGASVSVTLPEWIAETRDLV